MPRRTSKRSTKKKFSNRVVRKSAQAMKAAKKKLRHVMPPEVNRVFDQLQGTAEDWMAFASLQRSRLVREVRGMCDEILEKVGESPIFAHRDEVIREMRQHLETLMHRLNAGALIDKAIDSAKLRQHDLLSFLNVPSQEELKQLQRKLNKIETRLNSLHHPRGSDNARAKSSH